MASENNSILLIDYQFDETINKIDDIYNKFIQKKTIFENTTEDLLDSWKGVAGNKGKEQYEILLKNFGDIINEFLTIKVILDSSRKDFKDVDNSISKHLENPFFK